MTQIEDLIATVRKMREVQKAYYKARRQGNAAEELCRISITLEKAVDRQLEELNTPNLFDEEEAE